MVESVARCPLAAVGIQQMQVMGGRCAGIFPVSVPLAPVL